MTVPQGEPAGPRPRSTVPRTPLFLAALGIVLAVTSLFFVLPRIAHPGSVDRGGQPARQPAVGDCITAKIGAQNQKVVGCDDPYASYKVLAVFQDGDVSTPDPCLRYADAVGTDIWRSTKDHYFSMCLGPTH